MDALSATDSDVPWNVAASPIRAWAAPISYGAARLAIVLRTIRGRVLFAVCVHRSVVIVVPFLV